MASRPTAIVMGDGLAGLTAARLLARRGYLVQAFGCGDDQEGRSRPDWLLVPTRFGRSLPLSAVIEPSLPVDLVLAGGLRVETGARLSLVSEPSLRAAWRRSASAAGVKFGSGRGVGRLRCRGGAASGVLLEDGTEISATLGVDATGTGALLEAPSAGELVVWAREPTSSREVQSSWVGRAQLLLGSGGGSLGWRCVPRRGDEVFGLIALGPRRADEGAMAALDSVLGACAVPSRTWYRTFPRHVGGALEEGWLALGGAAATVDSLTGIDLPHLVGDAERFLAGKLGRRSLRLDLARRRAVRRHIEDLGSGDREALVLCGALGPHFWRRAVEARSILPALLMGNAGLARMPGRLRRSWLDLQRLCLGNSGTPGGG